MDSRDSPTSFELLFSGNARARGMPKNRFSTNLFRHKSYLLDQGHYLASSKEFEDAVNYQPNSQLDPCGLVDGVLPTGIENPGSRCPGGV